MTAAQVSTKQMLPSKSKKDWTLSQSFFGWPSSRPRRYTILLKKGHSLLGPGPKLIERLYRVPSLTAKDLLCWDADSWHVTQHTSTKYDRNKVSDIMVFCICANCLL